MPDAPVHRDPPEVVARVREAMPLVDAIALQVQKQVKVPMTLDELRSYGHEGLLAAARSYEASRGVPFPAWAALRVRGALLDGVRATGQLPRRVYEKLRALEAANGAQAARLDEDASHRAQTPEEADEKLREYMTTIATAMALGFVATGSRADLAEDTAGTPEELLGERELVEAVRAAIALLPDNERAIVERHYFGEVTVDEAAAEIGLSKSWGSRLHARALEAITRELKRRRVAR